MFSSGRTCMGEAAPTRLGRDTVPRPRAINIRLRPNNFNRDNGIDIPDFWMTTICRHDTHGAAANAARPTTARETANADQPITVRESASASRPTTAREIASARQPITAQPIQRTNRKPDLCASAAASQSRHGRSEWANRKRGRTVPPNLAAGYIYPHSQRHRITWQSVAVAPIARQMGILANDNGNNNDNNLKEWVNDRTCESDCMCRVDSIHCSIHIHGAVHLQTVGERLAASNGLAWEGSRTEWQGNNSLL